MTEILYIIEGVTFVLFAASFYYIYRNYEETGSSIWFYLGMFALFSALLSLSHFGPIIGLSADASHAVEEISFLLAASYAFNSMYQCCG